MLQVVRGPAVLWADGRRFEPQLGHRVAYTTSSDYLGVVFYFTSVKEKIYFK